MIILVVMVLWCIFVWNLKQSLLGSWPISINISGFRDVFSGLQCLLRVPTENGLDTMENLETSTFDDGDIFEWQLVRWHRERRLCDSFSWKIKLIFLWHSCGTTDCHGVLSTGTCWLPHQDRWLLDPDRAPAEPKITETMKIISYHQITQWISGEICGFQDLTPVMVWLTSLFYFFSTCLQPQESSMVSIFSIRWPVPRAESLTGSSEKMSSKMSWLSLNFFVCFVSTVAWCGMSFWDFLSIQLFGPPTDWFWQLGQDAGCPWSYGWSLGGHRLQISSSSLETIYMWLYDHHRTTGG